MFSVGFPLCVFHVFLSFWCEITHTQSPPTRHSHDPYISAFLVMCSICSWSVSLSALITCASTLMTFLLKGAHARLVRCMNVSQFSLFSSCSPFVVLCFLVFSHVFLLFSSCFSLFFCCFLLFSFVFLLCCLSSCPVLSLVFSPCFLPVFFLLSFCFPLLFFFPLFLLLFSFVFICVCFCFLVFSCVFLFFVIVFFVFLCFPMFFFLLLSCVFFCQNSRKKPEKAGERQTSQKSICHLHSEKFRGEPAHRVAWQAAWSRVNGCRNVLCAEIGTAVTQPGSSQFSTPIVLQIAPDIRR